MGGRIKSEAFTKYQCIWRCSDDINICIISYVLVTFSLNSSIGSTICLKICHLTVWKKQRNTKQIKLYSNKSSTTNKIVKQLNGCFVLCLEIWECHSCWPCPCYLAHVVSASPGCCCMDGLRVLHLCHMERRRKVLYRNHLPVGRIMIANSILFEVPEVFHMFCLITFSFFTNKTFPVFNIPKYIP